MEIHNGRDAIQHLFQIPRVLPLQLVWFQSSDRRRWARSDLNVRDIPKGDIPSQVRIFLLKTLTLGCLIWKSVASHTFSI